MMRRSFELLVVLAVLLGAFHWLSERHERKVETLAAAVESGSGSNLPPVVMPPMRSAETPPAPLEQPAPKKHFWQRKETAPPEPLETKEETVVEQSAPDSRSRFGVPRPDAQFSGAKLILWESGCPRGEEALRHAETYCRHHGGTIGPGPQYDIWVIRVPREREPQCPCFQFYYNGTHVPPDMIGYGGPDQLRFVFARIPRCPPDWYRGQPQQPRVKANWGPGIGIRYKSDTDVGLGLGFGSGWAPTYAGGCP
jgi:hypothetical protein